MKECKHVSLKNVSESETYLEFGHGQLQGDASSIQVLWSQIGLVPASSTLLIVIKNCFLELLLLLLLYFEINLNILLMQVINANILKPKGMLYNVVLI